MNTVTISLERYEEMKSEIERLRKEVQQKTIIKYSVSENVRVIVSCILIASAIIAFVLSGIL